LLILKALDKICCDEAKRLIRGIKVDIVYAGFKEELFPPRKYLIQIRCGLAVILYCGRLVD